jgi:hypothetical protein
MKRYATAAVIAALAVPIGVAEAKVSNDSPGCNPGEWVKVTTVEPNGDTDRVVLKRRLPEGYSVESSGPPVTINSDGSVEAPGASTVECIAPTH